MKLKGILMRADVVTGTGRVYPRHVLEKAIKEYKEKIDKRQAYGTMEDSVGTVMLRLVDVSHLVTDMSMDGDDVNVEIEVFDTDKGKMLQEWIEAGEVRFGITGVSRVSVVEGKKKIVANDFQLISVSASLDKPDATQSIRKVDEMTYESDGVQAGDVVQISGIRHKWYLRAWIWIVRTILRRKNYKQHEAFTVDSVENQTTLSVTKVKE